MVIVNGPHYWWQFWLENLRRLQIIPSNLSKLAGTLLFRTENCNWPEDRQDRVYSVDTRKEKWALPVFILLIRTGLAVCGLWGDKCCPGTSHCHHLHHHHQHQPTWKCFISHWERLGETGRDWERGCYWVPTSGVVKHGLCCTNRIQDTCEVSSYPGGV